MYRRKRISVIVPAYNEEKNISGVVKTMPKFVDKIVVVDDGSNDSTSKKVKRLQKKTTKIILIRHAKNKGVGAAIASGYKWSRDNNIDIAAVMSGDGQALPDELSKIIDPVAKGKVDYTKANRLLGKDSFKLIPKNRFIGNSILSFLTKIASGYWHIMDSQAGYTAINKRMLSLIEWDKMYKQYGQPNDLLVRLNVYNARVRDIESTPCYRSQDVSGIKIRTVMFTIPFMLARMFFWRMKEKYILRDFHPLVLFYFAGFFTAFLSFILFGRLLYYFIFTESDLPKINFLAWMLTVLMSTQFILFAMWFDMEYNKNLR